MIPVLAEAVTASGQILYKGTPLSAMVVANGQSMFSSSSDGRYNLDVPLNSSGQITVQAFASGFAPYRRTVSPSQARNLAINMDRSSSTEAPVVTYSLTQGTSSGRALIAGTVSYAGTGICTLTLANGQSMFTCGANLGKYKLDVPVSSQETVTLFVFAGGLQPYRQVISYDPYTILNDTGIITCAHEFDSELNCPVGDHPRQDAQNGRDATHNYNNDGHAGFSFTKLDANGRSLSAGASSWSCVRDNVTGLIWEVKTDDRGLQDKDNYYSWHNPDNSSNGGWAGALDNGKCTESRCDTRGYIYEMNNRSICGIRSWRLPTIKELENIVIRDGRAPTIDTKYFPNTESEEYWTISPDAYNSSNAWVVDFYNGQLSSNGFKAEGWPGVFVRLVSDGD